MADPKYISQITLPDNETYNLKDSAAARVSHTHGNLTNDGKITSTATIASGDKLVIVDSDTTAGNKITGSSITFGTATNTWLNNSGTWTTPPDTKVTSVGNHYAPTADSNAALSASATGATASWSIDVVKAVQLQRDAKGHVTGVTVTSGKIPANPNTDTKQNITLATTSKAFITGVTTTPTSTAQALAGVADTGVYLTTTAGEISALRHSWHDPSNSPVEKAYSYWNPDNQSIDFVFN